MTKGTDIDDYLDRAETCRRWARLISDTREIERLQALADEYDEAARRLRSLEQAPYGPRGARRGEPAPAV